MTQLFMGLNDAEMKQLMGCTHMRVLRYQAGERIATLHSTITQIGILLEGRAHLELSDDEGRCTRMEELMGGDVFGELFFLPRENRFCAVEADTDCRVMFLDWQKVIRPCPQACTPHAKMIANLFQLAAEKTRQLSAYTDILSQRTLRHKILAYLELLSQQTGSRTVTIPLSLSALAEYLCVDRSAMMREIRNMCQDRLIIADRRSFTLLPSPGNIAYKNFP